MTRSEVVKELKALLEDFNAKFLHIVEYIEGDVDFREEDADFIIKTVCDVHQISIEEALMRTRKENRVDAKHQIRYIFYNYSKLTYKKIAKLTNATDHTTILNSIRRHEDLMFSDKDYKEKYDRVIVILTKAIQNRIYEYKKLVVFDEEPK